MPDPPISGAIIARRIYKTYDSPARVCGPFSFPNMTTELIAQIVGVTLAAFFTFCGALFWWVVNRLGKIEKDVAAYKTYAEGHFVTEADLTRSVNQLSADIARLIDSIRDLSAEMRTSFSGLQTQINGKADK